MSILAYIFCIAHYLSELGVALKIQIMGSLQIDDLFIVDL